MQDDHWLTPRSEDVDDGRVQILAAVTPVLELVARIGHAVDLAAALQAVLEALLSATGFGAGAINYVRADGVMEIVAVAGPEGARESLLGVEVPRGALDRELEEAERWGRLRFLPHALVPADATYVWVSDLAPPDTPDGWHPADSLLAPLYEGAHHLIGVLSVDLPVTGRRPDLVQRKLLELLAGQAEAALQNARRASRLRASEESFRLAFEATAVGTGLVSLDDRDPLRLLRANRALSRIAEATGHGGPLHVLSALLDQADPHHDARRWSRAIRSAPQGVYRAEKLLRGDGDRAWVQVVATVLPLHATDPVQAIVQVEDITERRRAHGDLHRRATSDPLTGLANRALLDEHLRAVVAYRRAGDPPGALLFCDLDDFKSVNDVFGHRAGDAVLRTCALRLSSHLRRQDAVFRFGGDEFVVVVDAVAAGDVTALVARIKDDVARPIEHEGRRLTVRVSVGYTLIDGVIGVVEDLLAASDAAMYADKPGDQPPPEQRRPAPPPRP